MKSSKYSMMSTNVYFLSPLSLGFDHKFPFHRNSRYRPTGRPRHDGHLADLDQHKLHQLGLAAPPVEQERRLDLDLFDHQCLLDLPGPARLLRGHPVLGEARQGDAHARADHGPGEEVAPHDEPLAGVHEQKLQEGLLGQLMICCSVLMS